jgi:hypothetical protein
VIPSSGVRLAYFDTGQTEDGIIFEVADLLEPNQYERILGIANRAEAWDGSNAVIEVEA